MTAEERCERGARSGVWNMLQIDSGAMSEHLHRHVQRAVYAGGRVGNFSGPLFSVIDKFFYGFPWAAGVHHEDRRIGGDQRDGNELVHGIGGLAVEELIRFRNNRDARKSHEQIVAVGFAVGDKGHAHRARCAGLVHYDNGIFQDLLQSGRHGTRGKIGNSAGRKRRDDGNRTVRVFFLRGNFDRQESKISKRAKENIVGTSASFTSDGSVCQSFSASLVASIPSFCRQSRVFLRNGRRLSSRSTSPQNSITDAIGRLTKIA